MTDPWLSVFILPAAYTLDLILGDPHYLPHPIRWMGSTIQRMEPLFRKLHFSLFLNGGLMTLMLIISTWLIAWILLKAVNRIHPGLGWILHLIMIYYCFSVRSLAESAMAVYKALVNHGLTAAKVQLSHIVGREVAPLSKTGVACSTVETVAENLVDGFISPLFYAFLGGAPLALTYKMINTLDSMIGYCNTQYREFGCMAARIDDVANYLPARFSVPIISLAAHILNRRGVIALRTAIRDGRQHNSPNAGFAEAAFAGALGIELGGPNYYHGQLVHKPYIGEGLDKAQALHIPRACALMKFSALLWLLTCWAGLFVVNLLHNYG